MRFFPVVEMTSKFLRGKPRGIKPPGIKKTKSVAIATLFYFSEEE